MKLHEKLKSLSLVQGHKVSLIGRSKNQKLVIGEDFVLEEMEVCGQTFTYKQVCFLGAISRTSSLGRNAKCRHLGELLSSWPLCCLIFCYDI